MLGFDRRIVLEDHLGEKHPVHLLETLDGHLFVLLPPDAADRLAAMQAAQAGAEAALEVLEAELMVMDVRSHQFLDRLDIADALEASRHHILVRLARRLGGDDLPDGAPTEADLSAHAFAEEIQRRTAW
jgi:hypothetical protein